MERNSPSGVTVVSACALSPLTLLYWYFDLAAVAQAKPYREEVMESEDVLEVNRAIERYRERAGMLPRRDIPI